MPAQPSKHSVIAELVSHLEKERLVYERIAAQSRLDAIDGEMKQEGKYDTRAIEASYLAGAQKRRLEEIIVEIQGLKALPVVELIPITTAGVGSLVEVESPNGTQWYFISPSSGGVDVATKPPVKVVSLQSPIGQALLGLAVGEEPYRSPIPAPLRESTVLSLV